MCSIVHLFCLFMKTHLLALLQDNYLDLLCCAFLSKLSGCVRNITAFCQHLLKLMLSGVLADTDISVKPKYQPIISARPIYRSISTQIVLLHEAPDYIGTHRIKNAHNYYCIIFVSSGLGMCDRLNSQWQQLLALSDCGTRELLWKSWMLNIVWLVSVLLHLTRLIICCTLCMKKEQLTFNFRYCAL